MLRTFAQHTLRRTRPLDGRWDFIIAPDRKDRTALPGRYDRTIHVPSAWEMLPGLENYRGKAWLRTRIGGHEGLGVRLVFGGVSHTGVVFIDGKPRGRHYDAFTPWDVVTPPLRAGEHELVVEVDNSFGPHSALHIENDYYTYGGITRPCELQYVPALYIDSIAATPRPQGKRWSLAVRATLRNWSKQPVRQRLIVTVAEVPLDLGMVTVPAESSKEVGGEFTGLDVQPWSAAAPTLYPLRAVLYDGAEPVDDLIDRVGFRHVEVRGKKLLLNGRSLRLQGYNRHEDHGLFGCAIPLEAMTTDLELMRDMGANFVRTCHYPNDMRFLDLCDEMGFYVWEESHARTVDFAHPAYATQITDSTREMVQWHRNHPSIIIWGCLNECQSTTPAGRREHARVLGLIKKLDPSRPRTFASMYAQKDLCLGLVDIVSWNRYDAWYGGWAKDVEPNLKAVLKWLHSPASRGGAGKPVIMSEFGGAAVYGCRNPSHAKWTEEYQAELLDESLRVYLGHADIIGAAIWQWADCRVTPNWWPTRARTHNNKGTVDEFRRRKMAYDAVKRRFLEARKRDG